MTKKVKVRRAKKLLQLTADDIDCHMIERYRAQLILAPSNRSGKRVLKSRRNNIPCLEDLHEEFRFLCNLAKIGNSFILVTVKKSLNSVSLAKSQIREVPVSFNRVTTHRRDNGELTK